MAGGGGVVDEAFEKLTWVHSGSHVCTMAGLHFSRMAKLRPISRALCFASAAWLRSILHCGMRNQLPLFDWILTGMLVDWTRADPTPVPYPTPCLAFQVLCVRGWVFGRALHLCVWPVVLPVTMTTTAPLSRRFGCALGHPCARFVRTESMFF